MKNIIFTITTPVVRRGVEHDQAVMEVTVDGNKMYARTLGNDAVSARVDVTVLWDFFKQVSDTRNRLATPPTETAA